MPKFQKITRFHWLRLRPGLRLVLRHLGKRKRIIYLIAALLVIFNVLIVEVKTITAHWKEQSAIEITQFLDSRVPLKF